MNFHCRALVLLLTFAPALAAADTTALRDAVTVAGVRAHQQALQAIADTHGGNRAAASPGHDASAAYVAGLLGAAGYDVTLQSFDFNFFEELSPSALEQLAPVAKIYVTSDDFLIMAHSGSGDVTAPVFAVDVIVPPTPGVASTSGCEAADFAGFPAGDIALLQRGTCAFLTKAQNAAAAGASAVIIFDSGQAGATAALDGTLIAPGAVAIPVVGTSYAVGVELMEPGSFARVFTDTVSEVRTTSNVLADSTWPDDGRVVMAGAHLDSVTGGPGINDNGSGAAALLEIALQLVAISEQPVHRARFAFWSASEPGPAGSSEYLTGLDANEMAAIIAYLDFASLGSPNFARFVLDGDGSEGGLAAAAGSGAIESLFNQWFASQGLAAEPLSLITEHGNEVPFFGAGIPIGGITGGHDGIKTPAQAADYGGTAGIAYDPCFHQACDTFANTNLTALDELSDAAAHAIRVLLGIDMDGDRIEDRQEANVFSTATSQFAGTLQLFHQRVYTSPGVASPIVQPVPNFLPAAVGLDALDWVSESELLFSVRPGGFVTHAGGTLQLLENQSYRLDRVTGTIAPDPQWAALNLRLRTLDALDRLGDGSYLFSTNISEVVAHVGGSTLLYPWVVYRAVPVAGGATIAAVLNAGPLGFADVDAVDGLPDGRIAISSATNGWGPGPTGTMRIWNQNVYIHDPGDPGYTRLAFDGRLLEDLDAFTMVIAEAP